MVNTTRVPLMVPPAAGAPAPGTTVRIASRETGGAYCVCEMTTMPGDGVAMHVQRDEELYYVLDGVLDMVAGGRSFSAEAGSLVVVPPQVPHSFRNNSDSIVRALMIFRPGGFDEMLGELREAEKISGFSDDERNSILARWGVEFL